MDERFRFPNGIDKPVPIFVWRNAVQAIFWVSSVLFLLFATKVGVLLYFIYFLTYKVILSDSSGSGLKHLFWKLNFPYLGVLSKYGKPINMDFFR